ncbi:MAG TPA: NUDIX domain-containing protein [Thermoplasmata archaeon]|nr:NUDIX domain-containing protein [Thermoplasmata archaeon]
MLVTAGIILKEGKILIAKREEGKWEFPGGKVEDGEEIEECLKRELKEELNININIHINIVKPFIKVKQSDIELHAFLVLCNEKPVAKIHKELRWIDIDEIDRYDFMDADKKIVEELKKVKNELVVFKSSF